MPVKRYGLYLAYPPQIDLRRQGLGRYLAAFMRAAAERHDIRLTIACPSWLVEPLRDLCKAEHVPFSALDILTPKRAPLSLMLYDRYIAWRSKRPRLRRWLRRLVGRHIGGRLKRVYVNLLKRLVSTRSWTEFAVIASTVAILFSVFVVLALLRSGVRLVWRGTKKVVRAATSRMRLAAYVRRISAILAAPKSSTSALGLYRLLEAEEQAVLLKEISKQRDVIGWYCPTAFWPPFTKIDAPSLICVPDHFPVDFPVNFARRDASHVPERLANIRATVRDGRNFVTYSESTKWSTLVDEFGRDPACVDVVRHGAMDMSEFVNFVNADDIDAFCRDLVVAATSKAGPTTYMVNFKNHPFDYIFFPTAIRPNKNILTLLRAYEFLLRRKYMGVKLLLTGSPSADRSISDFVRDQRLDQDVIFLRDLTVQELAACYRTARLAVNVSLSEGGFPFTFTEALSVGTPVVMARIPPTEEIVTDPDLAELMLFDPYDWRDVACRIEWGLENRERLLEKQRPLHRALSRRTWGQVVQEHCDILDRIAAERRRIHEVAP